jgi:AraC family transcriptional regulator
MDHYLPAIHRALACIEEGLTEPLTLEGISRRAGFSLWHFQRIFTAYVGEPLGSYVRRRRLTAAADELRTSKRPILDIALTYQFESHEAFTRAFSAVMQVTPSAFRRNRQLRWLNTRPQLTPADVRFLSQNIIMTPHIVSSPALHLVGLEARFIGPMSPEANNHQVIPQLFTQFFQRRAELPATKDGVTYGACHCLPPAQRTREDELVYLVGVDVPKGTTVPAGMKVWEVPAATYAIFTHRGPITRIDETYAYIFGTWMPRADYSPVDAPNVERYDGRFGDGGEKSEMDIMIAVGPRKPGK